MDVLAPTTMKDAAKCDRQCELQNSVNHQVAERKRHSWDIPERMSISVFPKTLQIYFISGRLYILLCSVHGESNMYRLVRSFAEVNTLSNGEHL